MIKSGRKVAANWLAQTMTSFQLAWFHILSAVFISLIMKWTLLVL